MPEEISTAFAFVKFIAFKIFLSLRPPDKNQGLILLSHDSLFFKIFQSKL